jgi:hypothetical protein
MCKLLMLGAARAVLLPLYVRPKGKLPTADFYIKSVISCSHGAGHLQARPVSMQASSKNMVTPVFCVAGMNSGWQQLEHA